MLRIRVFRSKGFGERRARARHAEAPVEFGIGLQNVRIASAFATRTAFFENMCMEFWAYLSWGNQPFCLECCCQWNPAVVVPSYPIIVASFFLPTIPI